MGGIRHFAASADSEATTTVDRPREQKRISSPMRVIFLCFQLGRFRKAKKKASQAEIESYKVISRLPRTIRCQSPAKTD